MTVLRRLTVCLLLATLLSSSVAAAASAPHWPGITRFQILSFTGQCLKLLQSGRFEQLARQYHVPDEMSPAAVTGERRQLVKTLSRLTQGFGVPEQPELTDQPVAVYQLAVQGLDHTYWASHDRYEPVVYRTRFSREGDGLVAFLVVVYGQRLQLRAVSFALPKDRPGAEERIRQLAGGSQ